MSTYDLLEKTREKPTVVAAAVLVILFWTLTPLIAQKYFNYSAINTSFAITTIYFVSWKLYEYFR